MRYYYFDASVLVKAYVWEAGTEDVRQVLDDMRAAPRLTRVVTSSFALVEVASAVARRTFAGELMSEQADDIHDRLQQHFGAADFPLTVVEPRRSVVTRAAEVTRVHRLRALDALHLATGIGVRRRIRPGDSFRFGSADHRLSAAAASELFDVFDPRSPIPPGTSTPIAPGG